MAATPSYGRPSAVNGSAASANTSVPLDPSAARRSFLEISALSPQEYVVYLSSLASIKPAPSGQSGLIDEQDALRYLRDECGMGIADELEILALFERTPLGLTSGHLFAMLRLVSWSQQGRSATKDLIFTQTAPARITHSLAPQSSLPATYDHVQQHSPSARTVSSTSASQSPKVAPPKPDSSTKPHLTPVREEPHPSPFASHPSASSSKPPAVPAKPQMPQLIAPKPKVANPNIPINLEELHRKSVPIPPTSSANPFRDGTAASTGYISGSGYAVAVGAASTTPANIPAPTGALLGFDPAPNPFKQSKPRIVKPTPVRASSPASNPFRYGTPGMAAQSQFPKVVFDPVDDAASSQASSSRSRPQQQADRLGAGSPALPLRPSDRNPPPLPPRHISPLIQAGLIARSHVRRAQESLPPKTFTVLQSSTVKHGALAPKKPRLLTGQAAPPELAQLGNHSKKRSISGNKAFLAALGASSAAGGETRKSFSEGQHVQRQDSQQSLSDLGRGHDTDLALATRRTSSQLHRRTESEAEGAGSSVVSHGLTQRTVPTVAPKPIYAQKAGSGSKDDTSVASVKPTLPSWLKEQEQLQREALASGSEPSPPPPIQPTEGGVRGRASRTVIDDLNDSADAMSQQVAAANAASMERNNPFFPPHTRGDTVDSSVGYDFETQDESQVSSSRPLERSKTVTSAHRPPPPRRRMMDAESVSDDAVPNSAQYGHSLDAGLHAGFKPNKEPKNSGGLRLVPPSKQAKMLNVSGADQMEQEGIRPAQDMRKVSGNSGSGTLSHGAAGDQSENSSANGPLSPTTPSATYPSQMVHPGGFMRRQGSLGSTIREKVSDILRLQEQPPKGQRQVDLLGQDIANFVNKNEWLSRKRDSLVRTGSGAARDRERLLAAGQMDGDDRGNAHSYDDDYHDARSNYAIHDENDEEDEEEDGHHHKHGNDEPHPDTDPSGRHSMQQQSRSHHQRNASSGNRDPFSSPPPVQHRPQQLHTQYHQHHAHPPPPPPQHPSGVRRSGSLNTKRSMSYNYPANVTVLSSTLAQSHHHGASSGAGPASSASSVAAAAAAAAAAAGAGNSSRRWSSFHHPENKFNQLHTHTQSHSGLGASREDTISAWRDLRGSAVDEEDADVDAQPTPISASALGMRDNPPSTGYVQF